MENKIEMPTIEANIESLNEDCIFHIYKYLQLDDSISLARTCHRLREYSYHKFRKYSDLYLHSMTKGNNNIELILFYIGHHVTSLRLYGGLGRINLSKIFKVCENLKRLRLDHFNWEAEEYKNVSSLNSYRNVELLTLNNCNFVSGDDFIKKFNKLKFLNIRSIGGEPKTLRDILENNPGIKSVVCQCELKDFQLLQRIPNVERLSLGVRDSVLQLNTLLKLDRLTKLQLDCHSNNINDFLREAARKGIMEEMELDSIKVDDNFFDVLHSFDKLKLLVISPFHHWKLKSSTKWPPNLTSLRLMQLELEHKDFISTFEQLNHLECIDLKYCFIAKSDEKCFADVARLSSQIKSIIGLSDRKQRRNVVLPDCEMFRKYNSKKYLIDLEWLRIYHRSYQNNFFQIGVQFPGHDNFSV